MKPVALLPLAAVALASNAVKQQCFAFEEPQKSSDSYLTVATHRDTSVIVYRIRDLPHTDIPYVFDASTVSFEGSGFGVCTEPRFAEDSCGGKSVGEFVFDVSQPTDAEISDRFAHEGEETRYNVVHSGIYCVGLAQQGVEAVEGVKISEHHSFGDISLAQHEAKNVEIWQYMFWAIAACVFVKLFKKDLMKSGTMADDIGALISAGCLLTSLKSVGEVVSHFSDHSGVYMALISQAYVLYTIKRFHKLSCGAFGHNKEAPRDAKFDRMFKVYAITSVLLPLCTLSPQLLAVTGITALVSGIMWIPLYIMMWRKARATEKEMMDPTTVRNFRLSRRLVVWIPMFLWITSLIGTMILQSKSAVAAPAPVTSDPSQFMEAFMTNFIGSMEVLVQQNFVIVALRHLPEFAAVLTCLALIAVWKDSLYAEMAVVRMEESDEEASSPLSVKLDEKI